jgi:hypothetical protein
MIKIYANHLDEKKSSLKYPPMILAYPLQSHLDGQGPLVAQTLGKCTQMSSIMWYLLSFCPCVFLRDNDTQPILVWKRSMNGNYNPCNWFISEWEVVFIPPPCYFFY